MIEENDKYFFSDFASIREKKGITLEDIEKQTKLQGNYITAIESGEFNVLPKVYVRLFLKTYANFLDLDSEKILKLYSEHISGKRKKTKLSSASTPYFIENKESIKDKINPNFKSELYKSNYFIEPKKIVSIFIFIFFIIGSWSITAYIKDYSNDHKIKHENERIKWNFFNDTNRYALIDSQIIEIKNLNTKNTYKYESSGGDSNSLIIGTEMNKQSITLELQDYDTKQFEGLTQFGIENGNVKFYINNFKINFKYKDKAIWGVLDPKKDKHLKVKYYSYKN